jgi:hypothetical protein
MLRNPGRDTDGRFGRPLGARRCRGTGALDLRTLSAGLEMLSREFQRHFRQQIGLVFFGYGG